MRPLSLKTAVNIAALIDVYVNVSANVNHHAQCCQPVSRPR